MRYNLPLFIILIILGFKIFAKWIPLMVYENLYAISLGIKSLIICCLPVVIFGLLLKASMNLARNATFIIGIILASVVVSSLIALSVSLGLGQLIYNLDLALEIPTANKHLLPAWELYFPKLLDNSLAMLAALSLGIISNFRKLEWFRDWLSIIGLKLEQMIAKFFKILLYLIPLFIAGFIAKLSYEGVMLSLLKDYTIILATILLAQLLYILLGYLVVNNFNFRAWVDNLSYMLPAAISGFTTMSSAASMPLTIMGVTKSLKSKDLANIVVPATVNIHLIGDCFTIPILAYAVLKNYAINLPSLIDNLWFICYFVIAKFSVAAIPGGGIIVMLPVLSAYLKFNPEMLSLITALYILFDPINTCANILGNGALAKLIEKIADLRAKS